MPTRARRGAARRRCGGRPTVSRRRSPGLDRPLGRYLLELEADHAEGRSWFGEPGPAELVDWEPVLERAGVRVAPHRVAAAYLELAVLVRALEGLSAQVRWQSPIDKSSLWAGLFDLRENLLGRAHDDLGYRGLTAAPSLGQAARDQSGVSTVGCVAVDTSGVAAYAARHGRRSSPSSARSTSTSSPASSGCRGRARRSPGPRSSAFPGGKGANQAVAAARLGAQVRLVGAVGTDPLAEEALAGLRAAGVELELERAGTTGIALILVARDGENQIVVIPGANAAVRPVSPAGAVLCQLEVPDDVVAAAAREAEFFALNAAPARPIDLVPDLLIVNRLEHEVVSRGSLVAVTYGADGAALFEDGVEVARAAPPAVDAVDGTAAGDAFAACLVVSLLEGRAAGRGAAPRLRGRRARGVAARRTTVPAHRRRGRRDTRRMTPTPIVLDCDPGHDDAIAILLALASPELELVGVTTVSGNQTLDKTTANALRVLELAGRGDVPVHAGADAPFVRRRDVAAHVHGESGLDGPDLPPARQRACSRSTPSSTSPSSSAPSRRRRSSRRAR